MTASKFPSAAMTHTGVKVFRDKTLPLTIVQQGTSYELLYNGVVWFRYHDLQTVLARARAHTCCEINWKIYDNRLIGRMVL